MRNQNELHFKNRFEICHKITKIYIPIIVIASINDCIGSHTLNCGIIHEKTDHKHEFLLFSFEPDVKFSFVLKFRYVFPTNYKNEGENLTKHRLKHNKDERKSH